MKKIGIIGSGESGVGAALLAQAKGDPPFVSDFGKIAPAYRQRLIENNVRFEENGHSFDVLVESDLIVKSPGVPDHVKIITDLKKAGKIIISELEYAYRHRYTDSKIIGITGSNGKTTTTNLTHHLLKTGDVDAVKGGNLGTCFSNLLLEPKHDVYVLEISSFQLDGIVEFCPDIAMLLNITPDHLDRYDYSFDLYAQSKMKIFSNQQEDHVALYNGDDSDIVKRLSDRHSSQHVAVLSQGFSKFEFDMKNAALRGEHNMYNANFAVHVARLFEIPDDHIQQSLDGFVNDDHRMQVVAVINGVEWINDSKATNIDSTKYALKSMNKPVIWIAGGTDKGNDYTELFPYTRSNVKVLIALGADNQKIINAFEKEDLELISTNSMKEALELAMLKAVQGDAVLLSPACASFDLFKNYKDRGDQFVAGVWDLLR